MFLYAVLGDGLVGVYFFEEVFELAFLEYPALGTESMSSSDLLLATFVSLVFYFAWVRRLPGLPFLPLGFLFALFALSVVLAVAQYGLRSPCCVFSLSLRSRFALRVFLIGYFRLFFCGICGFSPFRGIFRVPGCPPGGDLRRVVLGICRK